jgi:hypothetical protein
MSTTSQVSSLGEKTPTSPFSDTERTSVKAEKKRLPEVYQGLRIETKSRFTETYDFLGPEPIGETPYYPAIDFAMATAQKELYQWQRGEPLPTTRKEYDAYTDRSRDFFELSRKEELAECKQKFQEWCENNPNATESEIQKKYHQLFNTLGYLKIYQVFCNQTGFDPQRHFSENLFNLLAIKKEKEKWTK